MIKLAYCITSFENIFNKWWESDGELVTDVKDSKSFCTIYKGESPMLMDVCDIAFNHSNFNTSYKNLDIPNKSSDSLRLKIWNLNFSCNRYIQFNSYIYLRNIFSSAVQSASYETVRGVPIWIKVGIHPGMFPGRTPCFYRPQMLAQCYTNLLSLFFLGTRPFVRSYMN